MGGGFLLDGQIHTYIHTFTHRNTHSCGGGFLFLRCLLTVHTYIHLTFDWSLRSHEYTYSTYIQYIHIYTPYHTTTVYLRDDSMSR